MDNSSPFDLSSPPASPVPAPQSDFQRVYGCLTAFLAVAVFGCASALGFVWIFSFAPGIPGIGSALSYALRAAAYAAILAVPLGLVAIFLRGPRFALWRGIALSLTLAGLHAGLVGGLLSINHLPNVSLPYWLPSLVSILFSLAVMLIARRRFLARPALAPLILATAFGVLVMIGWLSAGTLGTLVELALSTLDALASALIGAVLIRVVFIFDDDLPARRPFLSALLAALAFAAAESGLVAVRGYFLQGSILSLLLLPAGLIAGALLTLEDRPDPRRLWWGAFAFLFVALWIAYNWTEGFEGDYMFEDLSAPWGWVLLPGLLTAVLSGAALLAIRRWLRALFTRQVVAAIVTLLALLAGSGVYAFDGRPGVQPETFFVVLKDQPDTSSALQIADLQQRRLAVYTALTKESLASQADLRAFLDTRHVRYTPYYLVNGLEVYGDPLLKGQIGARSDVARILDSPHARALPPRAETFAIPAGQGAVQPPGVAWGVAKMRVDQVWTEFNVTGTGIVVGSADTGVDWTHPALRSQYLGSGNSHDYTWFDPWYGASVPEDEFGHGTHTVGTILGQGGIGIAPGARWIACRNLARNLGNPALYLDCMQFLFAPFPLKGDPFTAGDPSRGADVVNNSWGCPPAEGCDVATLSIAIRHLYDAGQMYIVGAGNDGPDCSTITSPANAEDALTVGAIDSSGQIAFFSSRGPVADDGSGQIKPDVVAPGMDIMSSVPGGYAALDGTSMATPHVTGLVALLWSANPKLKGDIDRTKRIIEQTAHPESGSGPCGLTGEDQNNTYGYGWVDAYEAVKLALQP